MVCRAPENQGAFSASTGVSSRVAEHRGPIGNSTWAVRSGLAALKMGAMHALRMPSAEQNLSGALFMADHHDFLHANQYRQPFHQRRIRPPLRAPTPVAAPTLLAWSDDLAQSLGLAAPDDAQVVADVLAAIRTPYTADPAPARFTAKSPEWTRHALGCSALSCSS